MNAIITGATKGIGRAIAEKLATKGFDLCICSRNGDDLQAAEVALKKINPSIRVFTFKADLGVKSQTLDFANFCLLSFEKIDVLINNAGLYIGGEVVTEEDGALEKMIETNLYSAYHLTRKLLGNMIENQSGYIINMASVASLLAYPNGGSYSISKFALRGFSMVLREELKSKGIKVTTVMPGATWSNSWVGVDLPQARLMQATDIAEAVWSLFEMSPAAVVEELILRPQLGDL